jgi:hypothetical protein
MLLALQIVCVFLAAVAMSMALAHALELPGKLRLSRESYAVVQTIYYPGFTIGAGLEMLAVAAALALAIATPDELAGFGWTLGGAAALAVMHAVYWIATHPVNRFWLEGQDLKGLGAGFFAFDPLKRRAAGPRDGDDAWRRARDRWEFSHVLRAALAAAAHVALTVAVALRAAA